MASPFACCSPRWILEVPLSEYGLIESVKNNDSYIHLQFMSNLITSPIRTAVSTTSRNWGCGGGRGAPPNNYGFTFPCQDKDTPQQFATLTGVGDRGVLAPTVDTSIGEIHLPSSVTVLKLSLCLSRVGALLENASGLISLLCPNGRLALFDSLY